MQVLLKLQEEDSLRHQSTAQPFSDRKSSQAFFKARFGRRSAMLRGSRVKGSVCDLFRCSITVDRSYEFPVLVTTGSCIIAKEILSIR